MRPPITYYGGKQRLVKELIKLIPEHRLYCEPFMGGGALYFNKPPSDAEIINDINGEVSNFYSVVQTHFEELKEKVESTLHSRRTYKEAMDIYKHPEDKDAVLRAWAFWVATNQGFAGKIGSWALSRDNKIGKTLAGKREGFTKEYAERLKFTEIESDDGVKVIKHYDREDTFFYIDPPYLNSDCGHYKGYTEADYINLLNMLSSLKGKFLLSSYPSGILSEYIEKQGWNSKEKKQKVSVTCLAKKEKTEVMVYNYTEPLIVSGDSPPLHNFSDMCKQSGVENLEVVMKYSGQESLDLAGEVSCFGASINQYDPMKTTLSPHINNSTPLIADGGSPLEIISRIHKSLSNGIRSGKAKIPRQWLQERGLTIEGSMAVFNSGQIHHHKPQAYKDELESVGFLVASNVGTNAGQKPYKVFGFYSMIFPLKDEQGRVVSFYAIGIKNNEKAFFNKEGIYPAFPPPLTKKLYVTENIVDAATLMEASIVDNREAVMALHDGELLPQHETAIKSLKYLEEIVWVGKPNNEIEK